MPSYNRSPNLPHIMPFCTRHSYFPQINLYLPKYCPLALLFNLYWGTTKRLSRLIKPFTEFFVPIKCASLPFKSVSSRDLPCGQYKLNIKKNVVLNLHIFKNVIFLGLLYILTLIQCNTIYNNIQWFPHSVTNIATKIWMNLVYSCTFCFDNLVFPFPH